MSPVEAVCKWRRMFMWWQLGQRPKGAPAAGDAVSDHREITMLLRAEVSALAQVLIQKKVFTALEYTAQVHVECEHLSKQYEKVFPGMSADETGIVMNMPLAAETMVRKGMGPRGPEAA